MNTSIGRPFIYSPVYQPMGAMTNISSLLEPIFSPPFNILTSILLASYNSVCSLTNSISVHIFLFRKPKSYSMDITFCNKECI